MSNQTPRARHRARHRVWQLPIALVGTILCAVACAPAAPPAVQPTAPPQAVKMVHVPSVLFAPLYVALARGYLREQGIDAQLDRAAAGQDAMPLLANGQLDVLVGGFSAATFNAVSRQLEVKVVASMGRQPRQGYPSALMVRKDLLDTGQVKDIRDLRGRKVALSGGIGATGSYWMATKLRPAEMSLKDIELVNMGFPDMVAAFKSQAIDAAFPSAPATTQIRNAGTAEYFGGVTQPGASAVGVMVGGPFMKSRPDVVRKLLVALVKGARDIQGGGYLSPENLQAYATYTDTPVDTLKSMDPYEFDPDLGLDLQTLQDMQQVFIAEGVLQVPQPLAAAQYADDSFLKAAVQQLGPPLTTPWPQTTSR